MSESIESESESEYVIETVALSKRYGRKLALDHLAGWSMPAIRGRCRIALWSRAARTGWWRSAK